MKAAIKKYKFEIIFLTIGFVFFVWFCNSYMVELPHLAWFSQFQLLEPFFNKRLDLIKILSVKCGTHGLLGYNLLFLLNTVCFKMTTFFDVYLNDLIVLIIGIVSVCQLRKLSAKKDFSYLIALFLVCFTAFSSIQLSSGTMETQVRLGILFFVLASLYIDKILINDYSKKDLIWAITLIFLSMNVFGTAYSFAGVPVIFLVCIIIFVKNRKLDIARLSVIISYVFATILYFIQYFYLVDGFNRGKEGSLLMCLVEIITHPLEVIRAICGYNASGLIGSAGFLDGKVSSRFYFALGAVVSAIMIFAVIKFIQLKIYKQTFIPVLFIGYSFFVPLLVMLDREISLEWVINEWYVVNTKLGIIGTIMILFYIFQRSALNSLSKVVTIGSLAVIFVFSLYGNILHVKRAKPVRAYYEAKQPYLFAQSIEELPVDGNGLTPLLATPEDTMKAIGLMKKYRLSVYKHYGAFEKYLKMFGKYEPGSTRDTINVLSGVYDDFWLEKLSEFELKTKGKGEVTLKFYYNGELSGSETGKIYVDGDFARDFLITGDVTEVSFTAPISSKVSIKIENDFDRAIDNRKASVILMEVQCG